MTEQSTGETEREHYFVIVPDESPASRTMWRVKQGPMTQEEAEKEAELRQARSERRYQARSGESLNLFPHLFRDDRDEDEKYSTDTEQSGGGQA